MRKYLKIEVAEVFGKKVFRIAEQTHREDLFGMRDSLCPSAAKSSGTHDFVASNGFRLVSCTNPSAYDQGLYVRGHDEKMDDEVLFAPSDAWLDELRVAVREYNTEFSGKKKSKKSIEVID
jgi:hypothetical protein